jgi:hypothetical protein
MTLLISKGITLRKGYIGTDDPDAEAYIAAVEAADEAESPGVGALETATKVAIHSFVKGCKNDGIWPAIKASCILAGARTLTGALVPLVGAAPTNVNFVSGDYNRKTGLQGDGSTKYLDTNRNNNLEPQDNAHACLNVSNLGTFPTGSNRKTLMGLTTNIASSKMVELTSAPILILKVHNTSGVNGSVASGSFSGFIGMSRNNSADFDYRLSGSTSPLSATSTTPTPGNTTIFNRNITNFSDARIAFYSIGESLDLALLDARVTALINAFGAAIP